MAVKDSCSFSSNSLSPLTECGLKYGKGVRIRATSQKRGGGWGSVSPGLRNLTERTVRQPMRHEITISWYLGTIQELSKLNFTYQSYTGI